MLGGRGSGYKRGKMAVEACRSIDIRDWKRRGLIKKGRSFSWVWEGQEGKNSSDIIVEVIDIDKIKFKYVFLEKYKIGKVKYEYYVLINRTACNYGGKRVWFQCPRCHKRVAKLYLKDVYFLCRTCNDLIYTSSKIKGDYINEMNRKILKIQDKLQMRKDVLNNWAPKPKGMHYNTYLQFIKELQYFMDKKIMIFIQRSLSNHWENEDFKKLTNSK